MSEMDWAKSCAVMDPRIALKYQQLPRGEQVGKPIQPPAAPVEEA